jgi:DNA-binding NtrC family response regulator
MEQGSRGVTEGAKVLVVDDNSGIRTALTMLLDFHGIPSLAVGTPAAALDAISNLDIDVVIQDMNYSEDTTGGSEGVRLFREIHERDPDLPILLMTAWTNLETAVSLVKEGAEDYFGKPWNDDKLVHSVTKLLHLRGLRLENRRLLAQGDRARRKLAENFDLCGIVYRSAAMQEVLALATSVAQSDAAILITGPNGSGKEKIAQVIQANSRRRGQPFVTVNAGGLPDDLLEAELFGAEPGAYTGAKARREGRFEAAHGGTLFLDELGNLSPKGQMKLLRVLQTGEFERLGSNRTQKVDVRILSATNADLKSGIKSGAFREDLFFRLAVIEIHVPPLRSRVEDIVPLAEWCLPRFAPPGGPTRELSQAARDALLLYDWPGNVRELQNKIQRASLVAQGPFIEPHDLDIEVNPTLGSGAPQRRGSDEAPADAEPFAPELSEIEDALARASGVISRAAAELGMSRQALYRRMARLGISMERRMTARQ